MKFVDLGEPTSFLGHVLLRCTQRQCKPNEIIIDECRRRFGSRISAGATENYKDGRNSKHKRSYGHMIWKGVRKSALKGVVNWRIKKTQQ